MKYYIILLGFLLVLSTNRIAQASTLISKPDPNFHIYICFGQSNMEGNATITNDDKLGVNERFKVMTVSADDYQHLGRKAGCWYTANPPLCRWDTGLTPADYFGRTLVDSLSDSIKIGVIVVAMGGSGIDAFDKDNYIDYYNKADDWQKSLMNIYGGNPYAKIIEMAKIAQQSGVIKGILLHQGETNNGQTDWPLKVKKIYDCILNDLEIPSNSIPLLTGEMLQQEEGGICWGMNQIIDQLPYYIPMSYIISSKDCKGNGKDGFHFSTEGARKLGTRYGLQMWSLLKKYQTKEGQTVDQLFSQDTSLTLLTGSIHKINLSAVFVDGHKEDIRIKANYTINDPNVLQIVNGYLELLKDGNTTVTASFSDLFGNSKNISLQINSTTFPLKNDLFNPSIFNTGSFDENTKMLKTGQWGFGGWQYQGINLSEYKYLVVKLGSNNTSDVEFKLFDENNYWGSSTSSKFGNKKQVIVELNNAKKSDGKLLDPKHVYIAGFWSNGSNPFKIDTIYLSNSSEFDPTEIINLKLEQNTSSIVDVYTLKGEKIKQQIDKKYALDGLPNGLYLIGNQEGFKKIKKDNKQN